MNLPPEQIARLIDLSAVRSDSDDRSIGELVRTAEQFGVYLVTVLPNQLPHLKRLLGENRMIKIGGNVGFPSGGQSRNIKAMEAREMVDAGCDEIDMVIDLAAFLSGRTGQVCDEIKQVVEICAGCPVKVIIETHYLNPDQIRSACDLAIEAGAAFVKTSTGWTPTGATRENIALIKQHVGERIKIKASGGIRDPQLLYDLFALGASRFGLSYKSGGALLRELTPIWSDTRAAAQAGEFFHRSQSKYPRRFDRS